MAGSLGVVNAPGTAEKVADQASDGGKGCGAGTEELVGHECGGDGGVRGTGEDGYEAHGGEHGGGQREQVGKSVAEGGSDVEEGGDFAAFEAGAEGEGGEDELCGEVVCG